MSMSISEKEAVSILSACRGLACRLATSGQGIYTPLTPAEQAVLNDFSRLVQDETGETGFGETHFKLLRQQAGLSPSDVGLLSGALRQQIIRQDPQGVLTELIAYFEERKSKTKQPSQENGNA